LGAVFQAPSEVGSSVAGSIGQGMGEIAGGIAEGLPGMVGGAGEAAAQIVENVPGMVGGAGEVLGSAGGGGGEGGGGVGRAWPGRSAARSTWPRPSAESSARSSTGSAPVPDDPAVCAGRAQRTIVVAELSSVSAAISRARP